MSRSKLDSTHVHRPLIMKKEGIKTSKMKSELKQPNN